VHQGTLPQRRLSQITILCLIFQDWFYYCLVYDPQQKALLADKGEIGIGSNYQPVVSQKLEDSM
jgi:hypothetical protein